MKKHGPDWAFDESKMAHIVAGFDDRLGYIKTFCGITMIWLPGTLKQGTKQCLRCQDAQWRSRQ